MTEIPVWVKAVLSVEEAAAYGNISPQLIRGFSALARAGRSDFPVFYSGDTLKIPRQAFERWLEELANDHKRLDLKIVRRMIVSLEEPIKRGRPRKMAQPLL